MAARVNLAALKRMMDEISGNDTARALSSLRMTTDDAAALARRALYEGDEPSRAALRLVNEGVLGLRPISGFDITNQPTAAKALESGVAKRVAREGARNVAAFDRSIPDAMIGDFDWYGLGSMDADAVGRIILPRSRNAGRIRDIGAGILARLSPKTRWAINKERAMLAAQAYKSGEMDTFLKFVSDNNLWGKRLEDIRAAAEGAGIPVWKHIRGMDTYQVRDIHRMITQGTGLAALKTGDLAKKIDDFYGALRLPDADRAALKRMGLMDPETEVILDPSATYMGQTLGEVPTGSVVDKIQEGIMLGYPQIGYTGFDLPLLDDPRTYRLQSDALREEALRAGKTQLRFQSDPWAKRHRVYPEAEKAASVVASGGARDATALQENLKTMMAARRLAERGLWLPEDSL